MVSEWKRVKLDEVTEIIGGGTPSREQEEYWNGSIYWATPTDVTKNNKKYLYYTKDTITEIGLKKSSAKLVEPNNILMTTRATIGKCVINKVPVTTNQGFTNFIGKTGICDNEFLYYKLIYNAKKFESLGSGSTFKEISKNELKSYNIIIPVSISEQQKIAAILSSVDEAIEKTEQIIEQTETVKKGLMQQLLTKGIGHTEFKESEIGRIPVSWGVVELSEVVEILDGQRKPIKKSDRELIDGDIPYYGASGTIDWVNNFIFNEPLILLAEDGENLKSRNLPIAFKIEGKSWVNNHAHVLRPIDININFLEYYLESIDYEKYISGSAQPKLNQQAIRKIKVAYPTNLEQDKIVNILINIDDKIKVEEEKMKHLTQTKQGLMQQLLTGKVRVLIDDNEEVPS